MRRPALRFAPSPSGRLHLGHAYSALLNESLAARLGARLLLRIEDIDPARSRPDDVAAIEDDLAWLGLRFDGPALRQSGRMLAYRAAFDRLRERGAVFPCFCTRRDVAVAAAAKGAGGPRDPDGAPLYPGTCKGLTLAEVAVREAAGLVPAWRLDTAFALRCPSAPLAWTAFDPDGTERVVAARPERWGDPVVVRRDTPTSYHLAVVVDDAAQAISHVVRGADLEGATDLHVLLQTLLGLPTPRYHHHALLRDEEGAKLAKRSGSRPLAAWRSEGATARALRARLGFGPS